ncbi:MAG: hypothetical protein CM15mP120_20320 [Pseudomonadota bacterium]|nr:MAG: hypothetical protein CM15mP120_20320 [Pseudomonadota bacterium]
MILLGHAPFYETNAPERATPPLISIATESDPLFNPARANTQKRRQVSKVFCTPGGDAFWPSFRPGMGGFSPKARGKPKKSKGFFLGVFLGRPKKGADLQRPAFRRLGMHPPTLGEATRPRPT